MIVGSELLSANISTRDGQRIGVVVIAPARGRRDNEVSGFVKDHSAASLRANALQKYCAQDYPCAVSTFHRGSRAVTTAVQAARHPITVTMSAVDAPTATLSGTA
jgi:hypothetical protein